MSGLLQSTGSSPYVLVHIVTATGRNSIIQQPAKAADVIRVTFLTHAPAPVHEKANPAPALELIGNLHSESLKAKSILPHEVK